MYEHLVCLGVILGMEVFKFKVMKKLHNLHNTINDQSNIIASISSLFESHEM